MNSKKIIIVIPIAGAILGYILYNPLFFGVCERLYTTERYTGCLDDSILSIGYPLLVFSVIAFLAAVVLMRSSNKTRDSWLKLAMWCLPLSAILIAITPAYSNSWMPIYFISKDLVTQVMAGLFAIISLALIVWKTYFSKK